MKPIAAVRAKNYPAHNGLLIPTQTALPTCPKPVLRRTKRSPENPPRFTPANASSGLGHHAHCRERRGVYFTHNQAHRGSGSVQSGGIQHPANQALNTSIPFSGGILDTSSIFGIRISLRFRISRFGFGRAVRMPHRAAFAAFARLRVSLKRP
jgi:hypothetical protein